MADEFSTLIADASFEGILFPVETASTDSGHDAAEHTAYRRRGADIEPTGRQADRGTLTIPLVNTPALAARYGTLFPDLYRTLRALFEEVPIGELLHPTRGTFQALIKSWHEELSPDSRSGTVLKVDWVEHNASALAQTAPDGGPPSDTTANASELASVADAKMAAVPSSGYTPVAPTFNTQLAILDGPGLTFADVGACFRVLFGAVDANLALATLATAAAYEARSALENLRAAVVAMQSRYQPQRDRVRLFTVPQTMALWQVAQIVYGDASLDGLILAANAIEDALFVPAGRVLTILPSTAAGATTAGG